MTGIEPTSDASLVSAYRAGSEQAAAALVARHAAALARYLYSSGAERADVEDLVQETLFRAFRRIEGWRGEAGFRSWLFTIAGNLLKDEHRRRRGRVILALEGHDVVDSADPEGELGARDAEARLRAALVGLPRLQREVFLLRVQTGAGYEEIARALDTTAGAARVHYHHAVKRLKESIR